ncbi:MAG: hypothetical protein IJJ00_01755 [Erysipelotrichaceae bacterium]|nr:hypothetical protein [Erysipelotrichaceae bacterium]
MIRKLIVIFEVINVLMAGNAPETEDPENPGPFKDVENVEIIAPKQDSVVSKNDVSLSYEDITVLDSFLDIKIETIKEIKEKNAKRGKTSLPSLDSVWDIANYLVGTGGSCFYVAQKFITIYMGEGHRIADAYQISDPVPGDVVYYANGGIGYEHWAIYLGPETALQGNYLGTTIIGPLYLKNATSPIFYRVP